MLDRSNPLIMALRDFDITAVRRLVAEGADLNARDEFGDPVLFEATVNTAVHEGSPQFDPRPYDLVKTLIDLGADPRQLADDGASVLLGPMFSQDAAMVELLLMRGVDPNRGCGEPWETVYSLACFDYYYEAWNQFADSPPDVLDSADMADDNEVLLRLDQEAQAKNRLRPTIPLLLRRHGALTNAEMARKLGGDGSERITWRNDGWHLWDHPTSAAPSGQEL